MQPAYQSGRELVNIIDSQPSLFASAPCTPIVLPDAELSLWRGLDLGAPAASVMQSLIDQTTWRQDPVRLFGRSYPQPRLVAWHGDPGASYRYSGLRLEPLPWTGLLARLRDQAAALAGAAFNSVLLNFYRDGQDSMGLHSDDEPELGPEPIIASLSLGAERRMLFRHRTRRDLPPVRIPLPCSSLLVMRGPTQLHWKHGIEKLRGGCGKRLNLTFRLIVTPPIPRPRRAPPEGAAND
jgi:alkylated DNA repair dioxygenase AlkB